MAKIYTKTGDQGETSLFSGDRVKKDHARVDAYGTVDELNSILGFVRTFALPQQAAVWLEEIQNILFVIGSDLATPLEAEAKWLVRLIDQPTSALEAAIDTMDQDLPPIKNFILPGGTPAAAQLHIARTVCRRAERLCVSLHSHTAINPEVIRYLNRLSDFLFTLARWVNHQSGESEIKWTARP